MSDETCNACGAPMLQANANVDDGCPCNSPRGVNVTPKPCALCQTDCVKPAHHMVDILVADLRTRLAAAERERDEAATDRSLAMQDVAMLLQQRDAARATATTLHRRAQEAERLVGLAMRVGYATCWPLRSESKHYRRLAEAAEASVTLWRERCNAAEAKLSNTQEALVDAQDAYEDAGYEAFQCAAERAEARGLLGEAIERLYVLDEHQIDVELRARIAAHLGRTE